MNDCANKQIGVNAGTLKQFAGGESQLAALRQTHVCFPAWPYIVTHCFVVITCDRICSSTH